jgi:hypothetical protein
MNKAVSCLLSASFLLPKPTQPLPSNPSEPRNEPAMHSESSNHAARPAQN